ncbi:MAG: penicillin acylase family protein [Pacificimonas sp.]
MKRFFIGLIAVLSIVMLGAAVYLWTPAPPPFDRDAARQVARDYEVRIIRDRYGVPHVYGRRDADVAFGLAYATAEDDIENIAIGQKFTRGQMGLESGRDGAVTDYLVAAVDAREAAEAQYERDLSPEMREVLAGYAAGLNFFCASNEERCEPGFAPVMPQEIIASYVSRTPLFYGLDQQLTQLFDGDIDLQETAWRARRDYLKVGRKVMAGSNAIAVAPSRAADGHTRLMVNSHQPFFGPTAWYEARLKSEEGWDMIGSLFVGTPVIAHGARPELGWAFTVNRPDLVDFYKLTVNDEENPTQYLMDGEWRDFVTKEITIRVRLWGPFSWPSTQTVRRSVHGPVFDTPNGFFAMAFAGDRNIQAAEQWYRMNKATNQKEFLAAMAIQGIPSFNIVYADGAGNIGYYYNAQVPDRAADQDWSGAVPGDRSDLVWKGIRPFGSAAPTVTNPSSGYVVNANHTPFESTLGDDQPLRADFPAHYGISDRVTNRGLRAQALYGGDEEITEDEFLRYKMDKVYAENSPLMTFLRGLQANPDLRDKPEFAEALALFADWDGVTARDRRGTGLAIRTGQIALGTQMHGDDPENSDPVQALRQAISEYQAGFGRIDPTWGEVNRLKRGTVDLPLAGGPDILRAIYSTDNPRDGSLSAIAGDSYILYADWNPGGVVDIQSIHHFGSAVQDETSAHHSDQTRIFAEEGYRRPPMTLSAVLAEATADYAPGER